VRDTSRVGDLTEFEVAAALVRAGRTLLRPLSSAARYDIAIDNGDGTIVRVQCKTGVLRSGRIVFRVCSTDARRPHGVPYQGQVDAFGVFCARTGKTYLIPMSDVESCKTMGKLRVEPPRNNQRSGVRNASSYEIRPLVLH
jgi:hypothetical protein